MLILTRRIGEKIIIGDQTTVAILDIGGNQVVPSQQLSVQPHRHDQDP